MSQQPRGRLISNVGRIVQYVRWEKEEKNERTGTVGILYQMICKGNEGWIEILADKTGKIAINSTRTIYLQL